MGSTPGGIFKKTHNPYLAPSRWDQKVGDQKKMDKLKNIHFFQKNKYAAPSNLLFDY
jgi:hypothetical protein